MRKDGSPESSSDLGSSQKAREITRPSAGSIAGIVFVRTLHPILGMEN